MKTKMYAICLMIMILVLGGCTQSETKKKSLYDDVKNQTKDYEVKQENDNQIKVILESDKDGTATDFILINQDNQIMYYKYGDEQYSISIQGKEMKITKIVDVDTANTHDQEYTCTLDKDCTEKIEIEKFKKLKDIFQKINISLEDYGITLKS